MTKAQAAAYLAAMIDGEGHIRVHTNRSASVANTEWDLIEATVECCELLGLHYKVQKGSYRHNGNRKPVWEVRMAGKNTLEAIQSVVPMRSKRKKLALAEAIAAYKYLPRPPREWLEQKYHGEGLSLQQVAEAWGVKNSVSAHCWMKYYGIPRRSQAESQTKYPRPGRAWLKERLDEGLTLAQIGDLVGAPLQAVWHWRKHYDLVPK